MATITKQNTFVVTLNADGTLFSVTPNGKRHTKPKGYTSYEICGHGMTFQEASELARAKHGKAVHGCKLHSKSKRELAEDWREHDAQGIY